MIKKLILLFACFSFAAFAESPDETDVKVQSLEDLLKKVQKERTLQRAEFKIREARFAKEKNKRALLLKQAKAELVREEAVREQLQKEYEKNEKELAVLQTELGITTGALGELFGAVKQTAGELRGEILESIVSAQFKNREEFLNQISARKKLPNMDEIRRLWLELQFEAAALGQVQKFKAPVVMTSGKEEIKDIIRVGGFNLVSTGEYLSYQRETKQIVELSKQPPRRYLKNIKKLEKAKSGYTPFALDPSQGGILSTLLKVPSLMARIHQGGLIGYVIILLFFLGLALSAQRFLILRKEGLKLRAALKGEKTAEPTALLELRKAFEKNKNEDIEILETKLEEIIIRSCPLFEKGLSTIKILAGVAPLLGLLGTVIGMIITFQSITLFGTGDPKIMAGGISQALMTTALGLCAAIPLLLLHNFIASRAKDLIQILEEQTAGMLAEKMEKG